MMEIKDCYINTAFLLSLQQLMTNVDTNLILLVQKMPAKQTAIREAIWGEGGKKKEKNK